MEKKSFTEKYLQEAGELRSTAVTRSSWEARDLPTTVSSSMMLTEGAMISSCCSYEFESKIDLREREREKERERSAYRKRGCQSRDCRRNAEAVDLGEDDPVRLIPCRLGQGFDWPLLLVTTAIFYFWHQP
ncbi:hypothetical protein TorRG33x02_220130 [Trema orientale]|uniref:Uncharacterized protein n=1 Tax=Trema orientale TaxID=63057 RepID=A0A2P5E9J9_TREOI|nr:hypothetical protein TorRG33x02_220130 [Trema orientale]